MKLVQINPVMRINTSTGRIMQEIGCMASEYGWESWLAFSGGRDGVHLCDSKAHRFLPVGNRVDLAMHLFTTRFLDKHGLASKEATRDFVKKLKILKPDVIHIHNIHGYFLNYPIFFDYLRDSGIPVVWTIHDCWLYTGHCYYYSFIKCNKWQTGCYNCPQKKKFPTSLLIDRSKNNFQDKKKFFTSLPKDQLTLVPVSQWIKTEMTKSFLKDYKFKVIHNGIDTEAFRPYINGNEVRARYEFGNRRIYLAAASVWSSEKGLNDLIEISKMLTTDEVIAIVGTNKRIRQKLSSQRIIAIDRTANIKELAQLYSTASAFLNPTWQDNYPTVNMEAISCGTPVITYRTGGSVETINNLTGYIVEQGDTYGMLAAARDINLQSTDLRTYALANFRKEDCYLDYIHLYNEITK